jgi:hypothetical protein
MAVRRRLNFSLFPTVPRPAPYNVDKRARKRCLRKNYYSSVTVYSYQIGATHLHTAEALNVPLLSPELWAWIAGCPFMKIGGSTRSG